MKIEPFINTIDGLSGNTKKSYEQTLWQLHQVIAGEEPTDGEILSFLRKYAPSSLHRHKAAIKAYLEFQGRQWPFNRRQFIQSRQRIPRYVPPPQIQELADAGESKDDYMFIWTLFQLGCRIHELMDIRKDDIKQAGVALVVKGGWHVIKPCTKEFLQELKKYAAKKNGHVFPESYNYYNQRLKYLARKIGISDITPHMLRHSRAVDLLNKGMKLPYVQQFLGHANINTTAIYLQITGGELGENLEKADSGEQGLVALVQGLSAREKEQLRALLGS